MRQNNSGIRRISKYLKVVLILFFFGLSTYSLYANRSGYTLRTASTSAGCGTCHDANKNTAVVINISSGTGSYTVLPNSITTFTVHINHGGTSPLTSKSGIDIAVKNVINGTTDVGTLIPGTNLRLENNELTQITAFEMTAGDTYVTFQWQAPNIETTCYIQVAALAANNDYFSLGDLWNWLAPQQIKVVQPGSVTLISPNGGEEWGAGTAHDITWTALNFANAKIELSSDGGVTYPTVLAASVKAIDGSWAWNISPATPTNDKYRVKITDVNFPQTTSTSTANFIIDGSPIIKRQPLPLTVCQGDSATFFVEATGIGMTYVWRKGMIDLGNSNSATYTIRKTNIDDAGIYSCIITGSFGNPTNSNTVTLNVTAIPQVTIQPTDKAVQENSLLTLSVTGSGDNLQYKWRKDNQIITGQTNSTLSIASAKSNDAGKYDCIIWNNCGSDTSTKATVTITLNGPGLVLKQQTINFDTVLVGLNKTILLEGLIKNTGSQSLNITAMNLTGANSSDFSITQGDAPFTVARGDSHSIQLKFVPITKGIKNASIEFVSNATASPTLSLTGFAGQVSLQAVADLNFDTVYFDKPKTISALVKNTGNVNANITRLHFTGTDSSKFEVSSPSVPFFIKPDSTKDLKVKFSPIKKGNQEAYLNIVAENLDAPFQIHLTGFGDNPLSVEETAIANSINIYPNPSNNRISVTTDENSIVSEIQIFDFLGDLIIKISNDTKSKSIEWNGLDQAGKKISAGIYQVVIKTNYTLITKEVVIVR